MVADLPVTRCLPPNCNCQALVVTIENTVKNLPELNGIQVLANSTALNYASSSKRAWRNGSRNGLKIRWE